MLLILEIPMTTKRNGRDIGFSLIILVFAIYVTYSGMQLSMGSMRRIGPGFFPFILGIVMIVLALVSAFELPEPKHETRFNYYSLAFISLAILSFVALSETLGLVPATAALVIFTAVGGREPISPIVLCAMFVGLCLVGYFLFVKALRMPLVPFATGILN